MKFKTLGVWSVLTSSAALIIACSSSEDSSGAGGAGASGSAMVGSGGASAPAGGAAVSGAGALATGGSGVAAGGDAGTSVGGAPSSAGVAGQTAPGPGGAGGGGASGGAGAAGSPPAAGGSGGGVAACPKAAGQLCHEFLASDNSRNQVDYVNEFEPKQNWNAKVSDTGANSPRSIELVNNAKAAGGKAALVSIDKGFLELDLTTGAVLNKFTSAGSVTSATRIPGNATGSVPPGTTVLARDLNPPQLDYLGPAGGSALPSVKMPFASGGSELRKLERNGITGNFAFTKYEGAQAAYIYEVTELGVLVKKTKLPAGFKGYNAIWLDGGKMQVSTGEGATVVILDSSGTVTASVGGKDKLKDAAGNTVYIDFFSGFSRLPNGNVVVANWLGHQVPADHPNTPELLELTPSGQLVWSWGNQTLAALITNEYVIR